MTGRLNPERPHFETWATLKRRQWDERHNLMRDQILYWGSQARAAKALGINYAHFRRQCLRYGINAKGGYVDPR